MRTILTSRRLLTPGRVVEDAAVVIRDGVIESLGSLSDIPPGEAVRTDCGPGTILPGFVDVHIHGAAGHDVMEGDAPALNAIGRFLASRGVAAYLATTVTAPLDRLLQAIDRIAGLIERGGIEGAQPIGIHLEGPFISHAKCGVHPAADILPPSVAVFDRLWTASRGLVKLITIAPELPDAAAVVARAVGLGVRVSLGHSNATRDEALAGIRLGASSATHVFNAMRAFDHREPGLLGVALDEDIFCELICDGIHVDPVAVRLLARAKAPGRIVLVTDAMSAAGMPDGRYRLGEREVDVAQGRCLCGGRLAGSVLTLDRALANFMAFTGVDLAGAVPMVTSNPASLLGLEDYGSIEVGRPANLVTVDAAGRLQRSTVPQIPVK